ncbi:hypothetical protein [Actinomadura craniellae]|uniref:hypothetical protein n=1 Tax=Actinomadura craniellae TaxID=2231787 RepID=UPI0013141D15|nr:hypothetical protein [Actinomadura craniellae]
MTEMNEADAAEQNADLVPEEEPEAPAEVPFDANEADVVAQDQIVGIDEDDYR